MNNIDPQKTIFYSIELAIKKYSKFIQIQLADVVKGISVNQMIILYQIEVHSGIKQSDLCGLLLSDPASITQMVKRLHKKNCLTKTRVKTDQSDYVLKLSKKGKQTLRKLKPLIINNRTHALKGICDQDISHSVTTLNKIINNC